MSSWTIARPVGLVLSFLFAGCGSLTAGADGDRPGEQQVETALRAEQAVISKAAIPPRPAEPAGDENDDDEGLRLTAEDRACPRPVPVYLEGQRVGRVCPNKAERHQLTIVDLSDSWTPFIFSEAPELGEVGKQPYRETYVKLADEQFEQLHVKRRTEQYLELFGIFPSLRVVRERFDEAQRHQCHDEVEDEALSALREEIRPLGSQSKRQRRSQRRVRHLKQRLQRELTERGLSTFEELRQDKRLVPLLEQYEKGRSTLESVAAMQAHLRCDGYLRERYKAGSFDGPTLFALRRFQRRHMIVSPGFLDADTRRVLLLDSREADFRSALRSLRERVVDAAGLIEDGSARHQWDNVLARQIDSELIRFDAGRDPLPHGARDAISPSTEAAARGLGWTSPRAVKHFFDSLGDNGTADLRVALRLPPSPEYHSPHMELYAIIDRGDVYYELGNRWRKVENRPVLTLYAKNGRNEVPLIRWATTIGGWQPENTDDGGIGIRYKNSPPGERIWQDVVASPAWLPPPSTPDDELVQRRNETWVPKRSLFGPGFRSAYGLVMMMHHEVVPGESARGESETRLRDEGIRTHGSVSYKSIDDGYSHGCHRLYNHFAVRLASFLLKHRNNTRHGQQTVDFHREVHIEGETVDFTINSRGYRYELTPPVPLQVLEGNILGPRDRPSRSFRNVRYPEEETETEGEGEEGVSDPTEPMHTPTPAPPPSQNPWLIPEPATPRATP